MLFMKNRFGWFSLMSLVLFIISLVISFSLKVPGMVEGSAVVTGNFFAVLGFIFFVVSLFLVVFSLVKKENKWVSIPILSLLLLVIIAVLIIVGTSG